MPNNHNHTIITMTDNKYFNNGLPFLLTRRMIANTTFVCYGCNLTIEQQEMLRKKDIIHKPVLEDQFYKFLNMNKFQFILNEMLNHKNKFITFVDWDTFFLKDFTSAVYANNFDLGITLREDAIKKRDDKCLANGGVIFSKASLSLKVLLQFAQQIILNGYNKHLRQYDEIWNILEDKNRPEEKRKSRKDYSWWVDQVFLSAIIKQYIKIVGPKNESLQHFYFRDWRIQTFNCKQYNNVYFNLSNMDHIIKKYDPYIMHLKNVGRENLNDTIHFVKNYITKPVK